MFISQFGFDDKFGAFEIDEYESMALENDMLDMELEESEREREHLEKLLLEVFVCLIGLMRLMPEDLDLPDNLTHRIVEVLKNVKIAEVTNEEAD